MLWFVRVLAATGLMVAIVLVHTWILGALHLGAGGVIAPELVEEAIAFLGALVVGVTGAGALGTFFGGLGTEGMGGEPGCLAGCATFLGSAAAVVGLTIGAGLLSWRLEPGLLAAVAVAFVVFPCVLAVIGGEEGMEAVLQLLGG